MACNCLIIAKIVYYSPRFPVPYSGPPATIRAFENFAECQLWTFLTVDGLFSSCRFT